MNPARKPPGNHGRSNATREWLQLKLWLMAGDPGTETLAELLQSKDIPTRAEIYARLVPKTITLERLRRILSAREAPVLPAASAIAIVMHIPLQRFVTAWQNTRVLQIARRKPDPFRRPARQQ